MLFRNDSVLVLGPIPPGPAKQLSYGYSLAAGTRTLVIPIDQPTVEFNLLVEDTAAICDYGVPFSAAVERKNVSAVQFHPEKSGDTGLRILSNWLHAV